MAARGTAHVKAGEAHVIVVEFLRNGVPMDTTGVTVEADIKEFPQSDTVLASYVPDYSLWASDSIVALSIPAGTATEMARRFDPDHPGSCDIQVVSAGEPYTYLTLAVTAEADSTP